MAFTYLILNSIFIIAVVLIFRISFRKLDRIFLITLLSLLILTGIFDNIMIIAQVIEYNHEKLLGLFIGVAPIEDFFYAVVAALLIPSVWEKFDTIRSKKGSHND